MAGRRKGYNYKNIDIDLSLLRGPLDIGEDGVIQIIKCMQSATAEVKETLLFEVDIIYECRVCRGLFRSLANLLAHKRAYCLEKFKEATIEYVPSFQESETVVVQPEDPPDTPSEKDDDSSSSFGFERKNDNNQEKQQTVLEQMSQGKFEGNSEAYKFYTKVVEREQRKEETKTSSIITLKPIGTNRNAVYQSYQRQGGEENQENIQNENDEYEENEDRPEKAKSQNLPEPPQDVLMVQPEAASGPLRMSLRQRSGGEVTTPIVVRLSQRADCEVKTKTCLICNMQYTSLKTLHFHMMSLHSEKRTVYPCVFCGQEFLQLYNATRHLSKVHHKSREAIEKLKETLKRKAYSKVVEDIDDEKLMKKKEEQVHGKVKTTHATRGQLAHNMGLNFMRCVHCGKLFSKKESLDRHSSFCFTSQATMGQLSASDSPQGSRNIMMEEQEICQDAEITDTGRWSTSDLSPEDAKQLTSMINEETLSCLRCNQTYSSISNLHRHALRHLGRRRFKCRLCQFSSYNRSECKTHLRRVHPGKVFDEGELGGYIIDLGKVVGRSRSPSVESIDRKRYRPAKTASYTDSLTTLRTRSGLYIKPKFPVKRKVEDSDDEDNDEGKRSRLDDTEESMDSHYGAPDLIAEDQTASETDGDSDMPELEVMKPNESLTVKLNQPCTLNTRRDLYFLSPDKTSSINVSGYKDMQGTLKDLGLSPRVPSLIIKKINIDESRVYLHDAKKSNLNVSYDGKLTKGTCRKESRETKVSGNRSRGASPEIMLERQLCRTPEQKDWADVWSRKSENGEEEFLGFRLVSQTLPPSGSCEILPDAVHPPSGGHEMLTDAALTPGINCQTMMPGGCRNTDALQPPSGNCETPTDAVQPLSSIQIEKSVPFAGETKSEDVLKPQVTDIKPSTAVKTTEASTNATTPKPSSSAPTAETSATPKDSTSITITQSVTAAKPATPTRKSEVAESSKKFEATITMTEGTETKPETNAIVSTSANSDASESETKVPIKPEATGKKGTKALVENRADSPATASVKILENIVERMEISISEEMKMEIDIGETDNNKGAGTLADKKESEDNKSEKGKSNTVSTSADKQELKESTEKDKSDTISRLANKKDITENTEKGKSDTALNTVKNDEMGKSDTAANKEEGRAMEMEVFTTAAEKNISEKEKIKSTEVKLASIDLRVETKVTGISDNAETEATEVATTEKPSKIVGKTEETKSKTDAANTTTAGATTSKSEILKLEKKTEMVSKSEPAEIQSESLDKSEGKDAKGEKIETETKKTVESKSESKTEKSANLAAQEKSEDTSEKPNDKDPEEVMEVIEVLETEFMEKLEVSTSAMDWTSSMTEAKPDVSVTKATETKRDHKSSTSTIKAPQIIITLEENPEIEMNTSSEEKYVGAPQGTFLIPEIIINPPSVSTCSEASDVEDDVKAAESDVAKDSASVEKDASSVAMDGASVEKDVTSVEKDGTSVEMDGSLLEKDGTSVEKGGANKKVGAMKNITVQTDFSDGASGNDGSADQKDDTSDKNDGTSHIDDTDVTSTATQTIQSCLVDTEGDSKEESEIASKSVATQSTSKEIHSCDEIASQTVTPKIKIDATVLSAQGKSETQSTATQIHDMDIEKDAQIYVIKTSASGAKAMSVVTKLEDTGISASQGVSHTEAAAPPKPSTSWGDQARKGSITASLAKELSSFHFASIDEESPTPVQAPTVPIESFSKSFECLSVSQQNVTTNASASDCVVYMPSNPSTSKMQMSSASEKYMVSSSMSNSPLKDVTEPKDPEGKSSGSIALEKKCEGILTEQAPDSKT